MAQFSNDEWFEVEHCCNCGMAFAMTVDFRNRKLKNKGSTFFCPAGHAQHYVGKTKEQKLKDELARTNRDIDRARREASEQRQRADQLSRSYSKVRERIKNGVCPCCTRTFDNLAKHMKTKHPEFGQNQQVRTLRLAFGMTQAQLAEEIGISTSYVSRYERGMEMPKTTEARFEQWVLEQGG